MEINHYPHTGICCKLTHGNCLSKVIITTTKTIIIFIVRIIPYSYSYIINTTIFEESEESRIIQLFSFIIIILYTTGLQCKV